MEVPFMNGDAVLGGSGRASFHGSEGLNVVELRSAVRGGSDNRGEGLNADAFALSMPAIAIGEVLAEGSLGLASARSDEEAGSVGVSVPEGIGDCGRPRGVAPRYEGLRVGV
jgi:hypothetical protein